VVTLEVPALRAGGREACRLLGEEVDNAELGHVLVALVVLDAEGVGVRVREVGSHSQLLELAVERDRAVVAHHRIGRVRARN
jgi:hypothetical protein